MEPISVYQPPTEQPSSPPLAKIFDVKKYPQTFTKFIEQQEAYYNMILHPNLSPSTLHHKEIFEKHHSKVFYGKYPSNPMVTPLFGISQNAAISATPSRVGNGVGKGFRITSKANGNKAEIEIFLDDDSRKVIKLIFCDERNYNILRIGDEVHAHDDQESNITFLINGDYIYVGGGKEERCLGDFGKRVSESNPDIYRVRGSVVKDKIEEMECYWHQFKGEIFEKMNSYCVSSEENMSFYTNFAILMLDLMGKDFIHSRTIKKMKFEEYQNIHRASMRSIFCGDETFTDEKLIEIIEKYPHLWKPSVTKHLSDGNLLYIQGMTVFTDYKFNILEKPWVANAVYGVGPLFTEDYDNPDEIWNFIVNDYGKLANNVITTSFSSEEEESTSKQKQILIQSIIGGRFQLQKLFENLDQHSNENIKTLIKIKRNPLLSEVCNKDTKFSDWCDLYSELATLGKSLKWDPEDKPEEITIGTIQDVVRRKLRKLSDKFAEKMRKESLLGQFVTAISGSVYDEVYISITPGEYWIDFENKIVVNPGDGPYGPGEPFMPRKERREEGKGETPNRLNVSQAIPKDHIVSYESDDVKTIDKQQKFLKEEMELAAVTQEMSSSPPPQQSVSLVVDVVHSDYSINKN